MEKLQKTGGTARIGGAVALAMLVQACSASPIGPPPPSLGLDPFYRKSLYAGGIPISGSERVPDTALRTARLIVVQMLEERPDFAAALAASGQRVVVMSEDEGTTDLPEQRDWKKPALDDPRLTRCERKHYDERIGRLSDREYWNSRARGMGGLLTSAATENLLARPGTRYYGENILVHEFSHAILNVVREMDPELYARVERAYAAAKTNGRWRGEYGETSIDEYWAEGTQFWFESNKLAIVDGRRILSARDLADYDPQLYDVLSRIYGPRHHLRGDRFHGHHARSPDGPMPVSTAEVC